MSYSTKKLLGKNHREIIKKIEGNKLKAEINITENKEKKCIESDKQKP